jgi:T-complex protein 1 subunit alpha
MSLLGIQGERETGMDVREGNVMAVQSIANIVKSSLGPQGLDKMLVDETGEVVITNDGATILKLLSIEHPAAKILGDLAQIQDKEVGDGTTSVVILSAELLRRATQLIKNKVHPTTVISGYRTALKEAIKHIKSDLVIQIDPNDTELYELIPILKEISVKKVKDVRVILRRFRDKIIQLHIQGDINPLATLKNMIK